MLAGDLGRRLRRASHATKQGSVAQALSAAPSRAASGSFCYRTENWDTRVERIPFMNPADVAQSALPVAVSADVSLIALFLQAALIVKVVMLGLLACSVWVWAIAIDKMFLYSRTRRSMDRFEQAFWSGNRSRNSTARCRRSRRNRWQPASSPRCASGNVRSRATRVPSPACRCGSRRS